MPKQRDLKRIVRARLQKTGESYTAPGVNSSEHNDLFRVTRKPRA